jgi:AcrR family transcriptional regulator
MKPLNKARQKSRDLLIQAAIEVFSREGIRGATTREIASAAGVNESTLFRNFEGKEALLQAVVEKTVCDMQNALYSTGWTYDLHEDLSHFADIYHRILQEREAFLRVFFAEAKQQPMEARLVIHSAGQPLRHKLHEYFHDMQVRGKIRSTIDSTQAIDGFTGMILASVLKRDITLETPYPAEAYLKTCVDVFIRGVEALPHP